MGSSAWWKAAGQRALRTFVQALVATGIISGVGVISADTDWSSVGWAVASAFAVAALAALGSLATSITTKLPEVTEEAPPSDV